MYCPKFYAESRLEVLHELIRSNPLATLVTTSTEGLTANHIPLCLDLEGRLIGHVAKANPVWQDSGEVLAIFHGPETYMSPSWYETKRETGKVVPTWNYVVVHAKGTMRAIDDPAWLLDQISKLTDAQEINFESPWSVSDAPAEFTESMIKAIVGIEITVTNLVGKWKVSQNQPERNQRSAIDGLSQNGAHEMARLVDRFGSLSVDQGV